jgi:hypothetical protein
LSEKQQVNLRARNEKAHIKSMSTCVAVNSTMTALLACVASASCYKQQQKSRRLLTNKETKAKAAKSSQNNTINERDNAIAINKSESNSISTCFLFYWKKKQSVIRN